MECYQSENPSLIVGEKYLIKRWKNDTRVRSRSCEPLLTSGIYKHRAHKTLCKPTPSRRTEGSDSIERAKYTCSFEIRACRSQDNLGVGFPRGINRGSKFGLSRREMSRITIITRTSNKRFLSSKLQLPPLSAGTCKTAGTVTGAFLPAIVIIDNRKLDVTTRR